MDSNTMLEGGGDCIQSHLGGESSSSCNEEVGVRRTCWIWEVKDGAQAALAGVGIQSQIKHSMDNSSLERLAIDSLNVSQPEGEFSFCSGAKMNLARPAPGEGTGWGCLFLTGEPIFDIAVHDACPHPGSWAEAMGAGYNEPSQAGEEADWA